MSSSSLSRRELRKERCCAAPRRLTLCGGGYVEIVVPVVPVAVVALVAVAAVVAAAVVGPTLLRLAVDSRAAKRPALEWQRELVFDEHRPPWSRPRTTSGDTGGGDGGGGGDDDAPPVYRGLPTTLPPLVASIPTYRRLPQLQQTVAALMQCEVISGFVLHWVDTETAPPPIESLFGGGEMPVRFRAPGALRWVADSTRSLNTRLQPIEGAGDDAPVLVMDDDMLLPCSTVELMLEAWVAARDSLVGTFARVAAADAATHQYTYGVRGVAAPWTALGTFNIVLTKALVVRNLYLRLYTDAPANQPVRDHVTAQRNCEDIGINFLVANASHAPNIWVRPAEFKDLGNTGGISASKSHFAERSQCVEHFVKHVYGYMPLVMSQLVVHDTLPMRRMR